MSDEARRPASPQSVTRVIRILEALCASAEPLSLADLSRRLATPKSSLAALLRGLSEEHFVVAEDGAWRLGSGAFGLGSALAEARRRFQSSDLIREGMRHLFEQSGETVLFGVLDETDMRMTYVDVIESRNSVRFAVRMGDRRPLYATAGGRALLAAQPDTVVDAYLDALEAKPLTPATLIARHDLAAAIAAVRAQGHAQTIDEVEDGVTGHAALVRDATGAIAGTVIIAAPTSRATERLDVLARQVREAGEAISRSLGYLRRD